MPQKLNAVDIFDAVRAGISRSVIDHDYRQVELKGALDDTLNHRSVVIKGVNYGEGVLCFDTGILQFLYRRR